MLAELKEPRQIPEEGFRRWFRDEEFDLIVWYDSERRAEITGFQLCYDKKGAERALTWRSTGGFEHHRVDEGEKPFAAKQTPILVMDGSFDAVRVLREFKADAQSLEQGLVSFVEATITKGMRKKGRGLRGATVRP